MSEKQSYRDSDDMPTERAVLEREWKAMRLALSMPRAPSSPATEPDERSEREAFEAWMRSIGKTDRDLQCDGWNNTGEYSWITERSMWAAWQARALAAPTAPAPTEPVAWGIIARNTGRMCQVTLDKSEIEDHNPAHIVPLVRATPPKAAAQPEVVGALPTVCDGKEQEAFEAFCVREKMSLSIHPIHYLFLDPKTDAARQAWKAALTYVGDVLASAPTEPMSAPTAEPVAVVCPGWDIRWIGSEPIATLLARHPEIRIGTKLFATPPSAATPEPSDAERLAFIAESKSGTIRLDGDGYNPDDLRAFAPVYVHWNAPQPTLREAIDAAILAAKGGKL